MARSPGPGSRGGGGAGRLGLSLAHGVAWTAQLLPLSWTQIASALAPAVARFALQEAPQVLSGRLTATPTQEFTPHITTLQSEARVRQLVRASCSAMLCEVCPCEVPETMVVGESAMAV